MPDMCRELIRLVSRQLPAALDRYLTALPAMSLIPSAPFARYGRDKLLRGRAHEQIGFARFKLFRVATAFVVECEAMRAVYRNEIVFSVPVDPHCNWTSRLCVTPSTERITCAGPSKSSASSSKRKSGPSCETGTFEPSRTTCIFTSAECPL